MGKAMWGVLLAAALSGHAAAEDEAASLFDQYFTLYETQSADDLPLTDDVTFDGSLLSETIVGKGNVVAFLNRVVANLGFQSVEVIQRLESDEGACAELIFHYETRGQVEYAHCLEFEEGQISAIRLYFDPRPFLED